MRLENKVALIRGVARGMGAAEAKLFASEGAKVVIGDILDDEGRRTDAEINESGGECVFVPLDVTSEVAWQEVVATAVNGFGKLHILVNNAGVLSRGTLEDTTVEEWDRVMDINAEGVFLGTKAAIPEMRRAGGGSIVNTSSISGLIGQASTSPVYNASKRGRADIHQVGRHPIRQRRNSGQLGASGRGGHPDGRIPPLRPGTPETGQRTCPPRSHRQTRGDCLRSPLLSLGRSILRHRERVGDGRWIYSSVGAGDGDRAKAITLLDDPMTISSELRMRPLLERVLFRRAISEA